MTELSANNYRTLSFDCYGTLIDWENGILGYLQPLLQSYAVNVIDDWLLEQFATLEPAFQAQGGSYRSVLARVLEKLGTRLAFTPNDEALAGFASSIEYWQPFPDTVAALKSLASRFELVVLSNIDDDLFTLTRPLLGVEFAHVITAQQVGAYKPDATMFRALGQIATAPVLHVAQSRFHDIAPATELGLDTVWINRTGALAVREAGVAPTWTFSTLTELAEALVPGAASPGHPERQGA